MGEPSKRRRVGVALVGCGLTMLVAGCEQTTIPGLQVHARPFTSSRVTGALGPQGTNVTVRCWTRGEAVHGHTIWYQINDPAPGYVTSYYVTTAGEAQQTNPAC